MYFVVIQDGVVIDTSEEVERVNLDELEEEPDKYYGYSEHAQQYLLAYYPELVPEEEKEKG